LVSLEQLILTSVCKVCIVTDASRIAPEVYSDMYSNVHNCPRVSITTYLRITFLLVLVFIFLSHTVLSTIGNVRWLTLQPLLSAIRPLCLPAYCHCYAFICHTQGCQVFRAMYFIRLYVVPMCTRTPYCYPKHLLLSNVGGGHNDVTSKYEYIILSCVISLRYCYDKKREERIYTKYYS